MNTQVMVVDDEPEMLRMLTRLLTKRGYEVSAYSDPREAIERAKEHTPAVVLTDVNMPQMTGFEVCRSILQLARGIQMVVMTASIQAINVLDAYQAGASDYVSKPVEEDDFFRSIELASERFLRWRKIVQATMKAQVHLSAANPAEIKTPQISVEGN